MTGTDDERIAPLRIGGWLPPADPTVGITGRATPLSTPTAPTNDCDHTIGFDPPQPAVPAGPQHPQADPIGYDPPPQPATPTPVEDDPQWQGLPPAPAADDPYPPAVANDPQPRPAAVAPAPPRILGEKPAHRVRGGRGSGPRSRRVALAVAATAAATAAVPLMVGLVAPEPDGSVPPPALLPTAPRTGPDAGTPTAAASPTAVASPTATPSASPSVTAAPGTRRTAGPTGGGRSPSAAASSPAVVPVDISIEAEGPGAVRAGATSVSAMAGASGGAVVTRIGNGSDNLVRFVGVRVPAAGVYTVTFHCVSPERRRAAVIVNGQRVTTVNYPGNRTEPTRVGTVSVRLTLAGGPNTIEFGNRNDWAPDLDRLTITR